MAVRLLPRPGRALRLARRVALLGVAARTSWLRVTCAPRRWTNRPEVVTRRRHARGETRPIAVNAPRIPPQLLEALARLDDPSLPIAEINRRLGLVAEALGCKHPSYERVRVLVHELRWVRRHAEPSTGELFVDVALRLRPPTVLLDRMAGIEVPPLRGTRRTS